MIIPKKHLRHLLDFTESQKTALAEIIRIITCKYDNLFECSFPYSMGLHQAPCYSDSSEVFKAEVDLFHFHMHYYPPLLRSATVKKFLVGFEMLGTPQRDLTSEQAADRLRALSDVHYSHVKK
jgi:UDPglucose--hexose-1-phosphate uridylyltransferase